MNERQWWRQTVQPKLHRPEDDCLAWKMQDAFVMGRPDVLFNVPDREYAHIASPRRLIGWLELKYDNDWPKRYTTLVDVGLTSEQRRHLISWYRATKDHRTALVLYGVGQHWHLFRHDAACLVPGTKHTPAMIRTEAVAEGYMSELKDLWDMLATRYNDHLNQI